MPVRAKQQWLRRLTHVQLLAQWALATQHAHANTTNQHLKQHVPIHLLEVFARVISGCTLKMSHLYRDEQAKGMLTVNANTTKAPLSWTFKS